MRGIKFNLILIYLIIASSLIFSCQKQDYPIAGVDPIQDISLVEDHSEVLVEWMMAGYEDMVLINVDHHDDLRLIPEYKIKRLKKLYRDKKWDEIKDERDKGAQSLYVLADFIYAAYRLGIVKRLYWIATSGFLEYEDIESGVHALLRAFGYPDETVRTFQKKGRTVTGNIYGLEVTISSLSNLPIIREPVLLTIDIDYFPNKIQKSKSGELLVMRDFFSNVRKKTLMVKHLSIAYSVNGDYTPVTDRHLGDEVVYIFKHPEMINNWAFPGLWILRDSGFSLLRDKDFIDAYKVFNEGLDLHTHEPSLLLGKIASLAFMEKDRDALKLTSTLVMKHPEYDYMYLNIGKDLGKEGKIIRAKKYLDEYLKRHPDSFYGLMTYGDALYANGRDEEALNMYQKVLGQGDYASAVMYAGDALFHLHRYREAMSYYEKGLALLNDIGYRSTRDYPEAVRNIKAIKSKMID